jgi:hypothetical protein
LHQQPNQTCCSPLGESISICTGSSGCGCALHSLHGPETEHVCTGSAPKQPDDHRGPDTAPEMHTASGRHYCCSGLSWGPELALQVETCWDYTAADLVKSIKHTDNTQHCALQERRHKNHWEMKHRASCTQYCNVRDAIPLVCDAQHYVLHAAVPYWAKHTLHHTAACTEKCSTTQPHTAACTARSVPHTTMCTAGCSTACSTTTRRA